MAQVDVAAAPAEDGSLRRAAVRGSTITLAGQGLSAVLRVGGNLVVTRLLAPEHFGLMALVNVFILGLHLFSDIGVGPNIIQSKRGEEPLFLDTAWTVQVVRGVILFGITCALTWPMMRFYDKPELLWLLPVAGVAAIIAGFESTRLFTLNRSLSFMRITVLELVSQAAGVASMIAAAWIWRSIWALVAATMVQTIVRTALSHTYLPGHQNRFAWDQEVRQQLFEFGRWIVISTAITFLASQSDRLLLGKAVSISELGFYAIAANLAAMPLQVLGQLAQKVFFPVVASVLRDDKHDPTAIRKARTSLLLSLAPAIALGVSMAPVVIDLLYDQRYRRVGVITSFLSIGTWIASLGLSYSVILLASARPKYLSAGAGLKTAFFAGLIFVVAPRWGIEGVALVVAGSELAALVVAMLGCRPMGVVTLGLDLAITALGAALVGVFLGIHYALGTLLHQPIPALCLVTTLGLSMSVALARKTKLV